MVRSCVLGLAVLGLAGCQVSTSPSSVTVSTKEETVRDAEARLKELDRHAADLKDRMEALGGGRKRRLEVRWKESAGKREAAARKLEHLKSAAADKWHDAKNEVEHAFEEFKHSVQP